MRAIITGASSGIGEALARELARRGWDIALLARRADLLEALVKELPAKSVALPCDVTDAEGVKNAVRQGEAALGGPFDLAIANAGVGVPSHASKFLLADAELMTKVNLLGMFNLFDAVIPSMIERRAGRFAGIASIAGLRGLPTSSVYSATKAAMQAFLEASRVELRQYGVGVTTVNPGFVITAMTEKNRFKMPFLMKVDDAARVIADGLERGKRVVEFPRPMSIVMRFARLIPDAIWDRATAPYARRKIDVEKARR
ncbi:MAG TPA: SDR family NAD(P)-dependent oxidoreductase [Thermoanaerobaculia bacterium]|jgi:short-subunit dehydrogenase|nr:SDR family NAD(P)-dependent oxidoreductase [Thermoanaerobaculia bacterium]